MVLYSIDLLIFLQGDIVDNIEQNVSKSVDHILVAKEQTKKALRYQTKARKVMLSGQLIVTLTSCFFSLTYSDCPRHARTHLTTHTTTTICSSQHATSYVVYFVMY